MINKLISVSITHMLHVSISMSDNIGILFWLFIYKYASKFI